MIAFFNTLAGSLGLILFFAALLIGVLVIPLGIPGAFLQVLAALALSLATHGQRMRWYWVAAFLVLALIGEGIEFLAGQLGAKKSGGSKSAARGALIGGFAGAIGGGALIPIPFIGSVIASFIGTFLGAILGQMYHQQHTELHLKVGFGALLGRAVGVACKVFIAFAILIASAAIVVLS
jgi:uncharacterized protein YqgC (DUF456 family)